jgi:hypothetical protein
MSQKIIFLNNEIKDVINGRKWQNSAFIKLGKNLMITDQNTIEHENFEARGIGSSTDAKSNLYYGGHPMKVGSPFQ